MIQRTKKALIAGRIYSIADLNDAQNAFSALDIKSKVPILVIDDQGFEHTERLRDEGYNLETVLNDNFTLLRECWIVDNYVN